MIVFLFALLLQQPVGMLGTRAVERTYHKVTLAGLATTFWTHVEVCGPVVYTRRQRDGDLHVTLSDGKTKVVAEFMPSWIGGLPKKGHLARIRGISRYDKGHRFYEVHPVEHWDRVSSC